MEAMDTVFMRRALTLASEAAALGEVPVGAVVVCGGRIIAEAYNRRELDKNALAHAELLAIDKACAVLGGWRLHKCDLYVTLEPCPMCAGAIVNARIRRVIIGAKDDKAGAMGSVFNINHFPLNHHPITEYGLLEAECAGLLRDFFRRLRTKREQEKRNV